jgi:hypothetical protein
MIAGLLGSWAPLKRGISLADIPRALYLGSFKKISTAPGFNEPSRRSHAAISPARAVNLTHSSPATLPIRRWERAQTVRDGWLLNPSHSIPWPRRDCGHVSGWPPKPCSRNGRLPTRNVFAPSACERSIACRSVWVPRCTSVAGDPAGQALTQAATRPAASMLLGTWYMTVPARPLAARVTATARR